MKNTIKVVSAKYTDGSSSKAYDFMVSPNLENGKLIVAGDYVVVDSYYHNNNTTWGMAVAKVVDVKEVHLLDDQTANKCVLATFNRQAADIHNEAYLDKIEEFASIMGALETEYARASRLSVFESMANSNPAIKDLLDKVRLFTTDE